METDGYNMETENLLDTDLDLELTVNVYRSYKYDDSPMRNAP